MENLPIIEIAELNRSIVNCDSFQEDITIADLEGYLFTSDKSFTDHPIPMRMNAVIMVLVLRGTTKFSLDYVPYTVGANTFIAIMPTHIFQFGEASDDFKGRFLVISKSFLEGSSSFKKSPSMLNYMQIRKNPCSVMEPDEILMLDDYLALIRQKIRLRTHLYQKEVLQNSLIGFFLELGNVLAGKLDSHHTTTLSRKEELFEQFLQLLFEYCKEQHVVTFYADKLFITPQYLSLILKELSGKSANKWIDDALIVEAKILLKAPQATVQQVADILHFSDQSTFGKFFKKHMGMSPMEYRKKS